MKITNYPIFFLWLSLVLTIETLTIIYIPDALLVINVILFVLSIGWFLRFTEEKNKTIQKINGDK